MRRNDRPPPQHTKWEDDIDVILRNHDQEEAKAKKEPRNVEEASSQRYPAKRTHSPILNDHSKAMGMENDRTSVLSSDAEDAEEKAQVFLREIVLSSSYSTKTFSDKS